MSNQSKGLLLAATGPAFWGLNSVAVDLLFKQHVDSQWFATFRLLLSGLIILGIAYIQNGTRIFAPFKQFQSFCRLILFSILGMFFVQYAYIMAIHAGNAATATVLQFTNPIMIVIILAILKRQLPRRQDVIAIILAILGTLLIATHGHLTTLAMSKSALIWGLSAAVGAVFYTLLPGSLVKTFGAITISGWAMLIAGIFINFIHPVWVGVPHFNWSISLILVFSIVFGTALAYLVFIQSLTLIAPTTASTLGAVEPLIGTLLSVLLFHINFGAIDTLGAVLIISTVFIQTMHAPKPAFTPKA
ncbi:EamA family transporter [Weissella diestrammenae]|uniref:EamA family transporter n=1 Tax=Weissella diestrammenae TaxID=1162633 RepID=A0A7G9T3V0_9LACO|nr:EamA family transporter [Weissella diestrammenae]MCM0582763.1 EamA family transporter [Weissella diestrammenae]QNN74775.1 EamA family transporter [Weissella diestrammenae]